MPIVIVYTAGDFPPGAVQEAAAPFVAQKTYATSSDPAQLSFAAGTPEKEPDHG